MRREHLLAYMASWQQTRRRDNLCWAGHLFQDHQGAGTARGGQQLRQAGHCTQALVRAPGLLQAQQRRQALRLLHLVLRADALTCVSSFGVHLTHSQRSGRTRACPASLKIFKRAGRHCALSMLSHELLTQLHKTATAPSRTSTLPASSRPSCTARAVLPSPRAPGWRTLWLNLHGPPRRAPLLKLLPGS